MLYRLLNVDYTDSAGQIVPSSCDNEEKWQILKCFVRTIVLFVLTLWEANGSSFYTICSTTSVCTSSLHITLCLYLASNCVPPLQLSHLARSLLVVLKPLKWNNEAILKPRSTATWRYRFLCVMNSTSSWVLHGPSHFAGSIVTSMPDLWTDSCWLWQVPIMSSYLL